MRMLAIADYHPFAVIAALSLVIFFVWVVVDFYLAVLDRRDHNKIQTDIERSYRSFRDDKQSRL